MKVSVNGEEISERGKPTTDGYTVDDIMRKFKSKYSEYLFVSLLFVTAVTVITSGQVALGQGESSPLKGMNFSKATEAYSHGGILKATIIIEEKQGLVSNQSVSALVYNGSLLGPTLHIKPGERMVVNYVNKLDQPTNLHFHGLHVSPSGSSDNVFRVVGPGETAKYVIDIPANHPGDIILAQRYDSSFVMQ